MSQRIITKTLVALGALLGLSAPAIRAQNNCQSFRAIMPMTFDINTGWSGPVYAVMGTEILIGKSSGEVPPHTSCDAVSCQDTGARSRMDFGGSGLMNLGDTVTIELQMALYNLPDGFATYRAMWKIAGGTGRFAQASGVVFESGPFVAWVDSKGIPKGQYIGELSADICGVKPPKNPQALSADKPLAGIPAAAFPSYLTQLSPSARK